MTMNKSIALIVFCTLLGLLSGCSTVHYAGKGTSPVITEVSSTGGLEGREGGLNYFNRKVLVNFDVSNPLDVPVKVYFECGLYEFNERIAAHTSLLGFVETRARDMRKQQCNIIRWKTTD